MLSASAALPSQPTPVGFIKDVDLEHFMVDVIEASKQRLVVVDFWAPWCGPCKQLTPVLEKIIQSYKGAITLAKIDIDKNPEIAQQMGVQSIPAVFAFFAGRPVDGFMGVQTEAQVKSWIERLLKATGAPAHVDGGVGTALKQAADFITAKDYTTAQSIYADLLDMEPTNATAYAGFLRCLVATNLMDEAREMLANAPPEIAKDKALVPVRTALELAEQAGQSGAIPELEAKVKDNAQDHQARFDLAMAHYAAGNKEAAIDELLDIIKRDRKWNDDGARKQLVKLFEAIGLMDPLTVAARKRLSSLLFS